MIIINTVSAERFTLDGIEYFKNFTPIVAGDTIRLLNTYDSGIEIVKATNYAGYTVNGATFLSVAALQSALLPVIFTRADLGAGGGGSSDDTFTVIEDITYAASVVGVYFKNNLVGGFNTNLNTTTSQTTLAGLYSKQDIPPFFIAPCDLVLQEAGIAVTNGRLETMTIGVFSNERVNNTFFYADSAINGQTLLEGDYGVSGTQKQGVFNFDSTNGVLNNTVSKGQLVYLVLKSTLGGAALRNSRVTLKFKAI